MHLYVVFLNRAHLDRSQLRRRDPRRDLDRLVEVGCLDQVIAPELLLRLGERPVGRRHAAVPHADGGCVLDRLQVVAAEIVAALSHAFGEGEILAHQALELGLRHLLELLLFVVNEAQILHGSWPSTSWSEAPPEFDISFYCFTTFI